MFDRDAANIEYLTARAKKMLADAEPRDAPDEFYQLDCGPDKLKEFWRMQTAAQLMGKFANESADVEDWHQAKDYYAAAHAFSELAIELEQRDTDERIRKNAKGTR